MKKTGLILSAFAMLSLTAFTAQSIWKSDKNHGEVGFSIGHLGISEVSGTFNDFDASISSTKADFSDASIETAITVTSIDTRIEARDEHLRTADFFDAQKYPKITFKSSEIKSAGNGKFRVSGDLTAKGVTKKVNLDLQYRGTVQNPVNKKPAAGFKLTGTINRLDFGIGKEIPAAVLSNEVQLNVNVEFQQ